MGVWTTIALSQQKSFDVVSVKPSPAQANMSRTSFDPGRLIASGVNLKQLIEWAYQVTSAQVIGGPEWMDSKFFEVEAKAEGTNNRDQLLRMLQPALADRFKLVLHQEKRELPVYVLTSGPVLELRETKGGPANIQIQGGTPGAGGLVVQLTGQSVSMQYLTSYLTGTMGRLVIDRTGLKKSYDFKFEVQIDEADASDKGSTLVAALWNAMPRLGLKLDSQKQFVDVLFVDHAEEPSEN
jgi:bla regulator protein blaR1